jgi:hypothetical protein
MMISMITIISLHNFFICKDSMKRLLINLGKNGATLNLSSIKIDTKIRT